MQSILRCKSNLLSRCAGEGLGVGGESITVTNLKRWAHFAVARGAQANTRSWKGAKLSKKC